MTEELSERTKRNIQKRRKRGHAKRLLRTTARNQVCAYCGVRLNSKTATADHKIPLSRGGKDRKSNTVLCCYTCNQEKGSKTYDEYMASITTGEAS